MSRLYALFFVMLASMGSFLAPQTAQAAESYDNCTNFITSLPAVITTQGTWCMNQDLVTQITSGNAIEIQTNNVTIDCNDFKLGNGSANPTTSAFGIYANTKLNAVVRNCNIRKFKYGVRFAGGSGHVVEDSRFDGNTYAGINVNANGFTVSNNTVTLTGGTHSYPNAIEIYGSGGVVANNIVNGVFVDVSVVNSNAAGIYSSATGTVFTDNHIVDVAANGTSTVYGIASTGLYSKVMRNTISGLATGSGIKRGMSCSTTTAILGNIIGGATVGQETTGGCVDGGGNLFVP